VSERRTKIIATIGPACWDDDTLRNMMRAGMDVARLNFSHGDRMGYSPLIARLRALSREVARPLAILQDLQGPKIRTGRLAGGAPVPLRAGDRFTITTRDVEGDSGCVSTTYAPLPLDVKPGTVVLLDDGLIELRVLHTRVEEVVCEVVVGGMLGEHKGINVPGARLRAPALTDKDCRDLEFGIAHEVDYVALSFVRYAKDVEEARRIVHDMGRETPIIAKIERLEALENLDAIIQASDGVMVARGDLGVETSTAEVPLLQKRIIRRSGQLGRIDITATQMLQSMIDNPRPTRAEASDVANAVFDGTDAVMLSGETAAGKHPVEAVRTMADIAVRAESELESYCRPAPALDGDVSIAQATVQAACLAARELRARLIACMTRSGRTALHVSQQRPGALIAALTPEPRTFSRLALAWGVCPLRAPEVASHEDLAAVAEQVLRRAGLVKPGDRIVLVCGDSVATGATNTVRVLHVGES